MHDTPIKTIFVCEFITGGGCNDSELPADLLAQGKQMRDALLRDLSYLSYEVITTVDARLTVPIHCQTCHMIDSDDAVWDIWEELVATVDAVWFIAPEADGVLAKMTHLAHEYNKYVIGCDVAMINLCSSKLATYQALKDDVSTIDTYAYADWPRTQGVSWLAKPDDGAGCEQTVCFDSADTLDDWLQQHQYTSSHVIQPYIKGVPASIACVMREGKAQLLSCNQQTITKNGNTLVYEGCVVNGLQQHWEQFAVFANKVAKLLPGLSGYIGIDLILVDADSRENEFILVEINPRLTTCYGSLMSSLGFNPAKLILNTLTKADYQWPVVATNKIMPEAVDV